jgi:hypothetical protein
VRSAMRFRPPGAYRLQRRPKATTASPACSRHPARKPLVCAFIRRPVWPLSIPFAARVAEDPYAMASGEAPNRNTRRAVAMIVKLRLYTRDAKVVVELLDRLVRVHNEQTDVGRHEKLAELGNWGSEAAHGVIGSTVWNDLQTSTGKHAAVADYLSSIHHEIDSQLKEAALRTAEWRPN